MAYDPIKITRIHIEITNSDNGQVTVMKRDGSYHVTIEGHVFPRHIKLFNEVLRLSKECDNEV